MRFELFWFQLGVHGATGGEHGVIKGRRDSIATLGVLIVLLRLGGMLGNPSMFLHFFLQRLVFM